MGNEKLKSEIVDETKKPILNAINAMRQEFSEKFTSLDKRVESLEVSMKSVGNDVSGLKEDVSGLKEDVSGLKEDGKSFKDKLWHLDCTISTLDDKLMAHSLEVEGKLNTMDHKLNNITRSIASLERKDIQILDEINEKSGDLLLKFKSLAGALAFLKELP